MAKARIDLRQFEAVALHEVAIARREPSRRPSPRERRRGCPTGRVRGRRRSARWPTFPSSARASIERPGHPDGNVAIFRTADDRVFAVLDRCPHKGGPLSQGIVFGDRVACPLHNWSIELATARRSRRMSGCARRVRRDGRARRRATSRSVLTWSATGDALHVPVLRRRLRRRHRARRRPHCRRARRSRSSGELRPAVHQGPHAASHRGAAGDGRALRILCMRPRVARRRERVAWDAALEEPRRPVRAPAFASTVPTASRSTSRASS